MSDVEDKKRLLKLLKTLGNRRKYEKIRSFYPDEGPLRRELYPKHMEHYVAGAKFRERLLMAGNRTGKTVCGAFETALHLTGLYDLYAPWWPGKKFDHPVDWWAVGTTNETTRDIIQLALFGPFNDIGSGMIPKDLIADKPKTKQGVAEGIESARIIHSSGDCSYIGLKSYKQKRVSFEGTGKHGIWLDEEPPMDIYNECLVRTATTNGMIYTTFTPLQGLSEMVLSFLPDFRPEDFDSLR